MFSSLEVLFYAIVKNELFISIITDFEKKT